MNATKPGGSPPKPNNKNRKEDYMNNIKTAIQLIAVHLESRSVKKAISYQLQRDDVMTEFEFRRQSALSP